MDTDHSTGSSIGIDEHEAQSGSMPSALELDVARYSAHLDDFDMTEEQGRALLETLWSIMRTFVEIGFSVNVCDAVFANSQCLFENFLNRMNHL